MYRLLRVSLLLTLAVTILFTVLNVSRLRFWWTILASICPTAPGQPELQGQPFLRSQPGDVLLVVDNAFIARTGHSEHFETVNWSYAWVNFLEQEAGGSYAIVDWQQFADEPCTDRRLIIISSSACQNIPSLSMLVKLRRTAETGGCVLLETPRSAWRALSGGILEDDTFNASGGASRGRVLAWENLPSAPHGQMRHAESELAKSPVFSFVHATKLLDEGTKGLGIIRDQPALWQRPCGRGWIVTMAFDWGMHLQAMQQGAPSQGWRVREINGAIPALVESQDLALSRDMMNNDFPFADMLEDWLAGYLDAALQLWPRWWRFPYAYDGVLALTHNEVSWDKCSARELSRLEDAGRLPYTVFSAERSASEPGLSIRQAGVNSSGDKASQRFASHIARGLLWKRFRPYISLRQQAAAAVPADLPAQFSRIYNLEWGKYYAKPFRYMAAAGIGLDSSYGPNCGRGYFFGTGLPFQALDRNGWPLGVWEWPFVCRADLNKEHVAYIEELLKQSAISYHQALVPLWQTHITSADSGSANYLRLLASAAAQRRHWLVNFDDYWQFRKNLSRALLQSRLNDGMLEAELSAPADGMAILLHGASCAVKINGHPAVMRPLRYNGERYWLVAVPKGTSLLTARMGGQQDD
ncbi:MAG: hypothetical protein Q4F00_05685 [bacterium]|nr:hypothetical protein [bacterium]